MAKKVLFLLAEGFEEVEAITPLDYLRRAGIDVLIAAVTPGKTVRGAHDIAVEAGRLLEDLKKEGALKADLWDAVLMPGGSLGAANIAASKTAGAFIRDMAASGRLVSAICASPAVVLAPLGLLKGKRFTCYPGAEQSVSGADWSDERVVLDGGILTSRGPGTAAEWALKNIELLAGAGRAGEVAEAALVR
ncbi:MAG: DJ-1/PfpI family protein [Spirochaetaceae bacterium]|jgi:4-methyl-5(b-hydroxyethyl)-thiazole monophosphate biosynthesis|nr:DJ-1/PfpI family protein [Spirochaetaceae bacterium]